MQKIGTCKVCKKPTHLVYSGFSELAESDVCSHECLVKQRIEQSAQQCIKPTGAHSAAPDLEKS